MELDGDRILVVGGTRGVGRAVSVAACKRGGSVMAVYVRDSAAALELESQASKMKGNLTTVRADVASTTGMEKLVAEVSSWLGEEKLTGLVFAAATGVHKPLKHLTLRHFDWTFGLNVRAFFDLIRRLVPNLAKPCSIVPVSSLGGQRTAPNYTLVGASKGALEALSRHLAMELYEDRIRVNILCPGTVETDAWKVIPDAKTRLDHARSRTVGGELVSLEEVANVACFLLSQQSSGINGATVVVDRGESLAS